MAVLREEVRPIECRYLSNLSCTPWDKYSIESKIYLIILNTPICKTESVIFENLWNSSDIKVCADGGSNQLYEFDSNLKPDYIKGDLDSILKEVYDHYFEKGVKICLDHDQDSTDLVKCLNLIDELEGKGDQDEGVSILIHGGIGGRLDQTFHTLSTILKLSLSITNQILNKDQKLDKDENENEVLKRSLKRNVWVIDSFSKNMTFVINKEFQHQLMTKKSWKKEGDLTCGIIPIGVAEAIVTTKGLRWDLNNTVTSMTGLLSTSNQVGKCTEVIEIESNEDLIWTMEIPKESKEVGV
ncbi:thiamine pyrophosphokinase [Melampsora americana]|nr:thiamine pyrophosphokinase [Melampsora americana]